MMLSLHEDGRRFCGGMLVWPLCGMYGFNEIAAFFNKIYIWDDIKRSAGTWLQ
ncbi:hypothetical protein Sjap_015754 [Stephania japonica]|uniref:Uncharacterized protein n=1 Tax=Stephania japonica TaxID=461633 RepID=A0AAP0ILN4_9MAGN